MNTNFTTIQLRRTLLSTVSASAMLIAICGSANAADGDHPLLWIELGGQVEHLSGQPDMFDPPFLDPVPAPLDFSPKELLRATRNSFGAEGKITFSPEGSDWQFSAAVRYGRSVADRHLHQQTTPGAFKKYVGSAYSYFNFGAPPRADNVEITTHNSERHTILDFRAGRDVGLGVASSHLSAGVRFVQFGSQSRLDVDEVPDYLPQHTIHLFYTQWSNHRYMAHGLANRSFHGMGPSIAWDGSAPIAGNGEDGEIAIDWGVNAALLFGRQRTKIHHNTTGIYYKSYLPQSHAKYPSNSRYDISVNSERSRSVTVPNVGGFTGMSFRYSDAKISLGYRADFFFGAMDGGIDTRKSTTRGFFGPFASISIGIGD